MSEMIDRAALLSLCERGFSPESTWRNRDSASAHRQLGECYALLRAGCDYTISEVTDTTLWLHVRSKGFGYFEGDYDGRGQVDEDLFYVPTASRLDRAEGGDWY